MLPVTVPSRSAAIYEGSHALIRRMPAGADIDLLRGSAAAAARQHPELAGLFVRAEAVLADAEEPAAEERRVREAGLAPEGPARVTVLDYADGVADLLIVASRDRLDRSGLAALADVLLGAPMRVVRPAEPWLRPGAEDWGLGDREGRGAALRLPVPVDLRTVVDATCVAEAARDAVAATLAFYRLAAASAFVVFHDDSVTCATTANPADDEEAPTLRTLAQAVVPASSGAAPAAEPVVGVFVIDASADRYVPFTAAPFPVTLTVEVGPRGTVQAWMATRESVLARPVFEQFARVLGALLSAYARGDLELTLEDAAQSAAPEIDGIVEAGRTPGRPDFTPCSIPDGIAALARTQPDAPAVTDDEVTLTYRQLTERSRRIAAGLRERGVAAGDRVAVCLDRDVSAIVTMLGVMTVGAAYVPIDPAYPAERLSFTAVDAGVKLVITNEVGHASFPFASTVATRELLATHVEHSAPPAVDPRATAYVIYTSGSTGRPKGVAVPHANVAALVDATREDFSLGSADVWSFVHSSAFDFSIWEIWGCLLTGGHLIVVSGAKALWPEDFLDLLSSQGVTVLSQTPAAFSVLDEADERLRAALTVRLIVFGGEALDARTLRGWLRRHPETRLVNMYGITETTVHVTAQTLTRAEVEAGCRSVGRTLPGWSVSVRDRRGRVLPFGVPGEIWVGGAGVASHYLNQPELTAARFVDDPVTGIRQYRSGDLGRLHPDGRLDHLGRIDSQVKLRGFRIELDEIRSVLLSDPAVRSAAVVVNQSVPGDSATSRLAAFVVLAGSRSAEEVRRRAASFLPDYMVPSTVTAIPAIPLTVNGKVDTARLRSLA